VGLAFVLVGDAVLTVLGVTVGDLQVAGGILLLVFAVYDLVHPELPMRHPGSRFGVMPLGVPLVAGPAVLTSLLTLARTHGFAVTTVAFLLNLVIVWVVLRWASVIVAVIGSAGSQAVAKVSSLLLAAIGVTLIRQGVLTAIQAAWPPR
jgi:multiple antibiotic resistance protein